MIMILYVQCILCALLLLLYFTDTTANANADVGVWLFVVVVVAVAVAFYLYSDCSICESSFAEAATSQKVFLHPCCGGSYSITIDFCATHEPSLD